MIFFFYVTKGSSIDKNQLNNYHSIQLANVYINMIQYNNYVVSQYPLCLLLFQLIIAVQIQVDNEAAKQIHTQVSIYNFQY